MLPKIRFWKTIRRSAEISARVLDIALPLRCATQPIERVRRVCGSGVFPQERRQLIGGVRLAIQIRNPGDPPLAIDGVLSRRKRIEKTLIKTRGLVAIRI